MDEQAREWGRDAGLNEVSASSYWFTFLTNLSVWFTLIGLPLTLLGLRWTWNAMKSAASAEKSARSAIRLVRSLDLSLDMNTLVEKMGDLKQAIRDHDNDRVSRLSSEIRKGVVKLRADSDISPSINEAALKNLITFFGTIENSFGSAGRSEEFDLAAFNAQEDILIEIREVVRRVTENEKL